MTSDAKGNHGRILQVGPGLSWGALLQPSCWCPCPCLNPSRVCDCSVSVCRCVCVYLSVCAMCANYHCVTHARLVPPIAHARLVPPITHAMLVPGGPATACLLRGPATACLLGGPAATCLLGGYATACLLGLCALTCSPPPPPPLPRFWSSSTGLAAERKTSVSSGDPLSNKVITTLNSQCLKYNNNNKRPLTPKSMPPTGYQCLE